MQRVLVVGTRNKKKREELFDLLGDLGLDIRDLTGWADMPEVVEDGKTFEDNARKKASEVARFTHEWVLAEDSGLVVPVLNGRPGVYSARYAGKQSGGVEGLTPTLVDAANNAKLLAELKPHPEESWPAYYVCVAALADPEGTIHEVTQGRCHGLILREPRGTGGFGYDPLFLIPEYHRTFGELSLAVKQALSHRARAVTALRPALRRLLN